MSCLLDSNQVCRRYSIQEFLHIARSVNAQVTIVACELYRIPSLSSRRHEFLLVHVGVGVDAEGLVLIIERVPRNNGTQVAFSDGGIAKDTITVVRAQKNHEYWQRAGQPPVSKGTLQWRAPRGSSPHLLDIVMIANAASAAFTKYYNCYVGQCYWYARVILASMAKAFPSCSEGTMSFSKMKFAIFGGYKISQVQFLVDLHAIYRHDACVCPPPLIVTPNSFHALRSFLAGYLENCLAQLLWAQPAAAIVNGCCGRTLGREPNTAGGWT